MLFLLTGDIQIGKTRWLQRLVDDLASAGVLCYGVIAPGVWIASEGEQADRNGFEKTGIDNVLLPQGERVPFAQRLDLAKETGNFRAESQAGRIGLGWHISDEAIAAVNAHLAQMSRQRANEAEKGLLVIDEIGRLELFAEGGLTEAMALLAQGPTGPFDDALVVARDTLVDEVDQRFSSAWGGSCRIAPDDASRSLIEGRLGIASWG